MSVASKNGSAEELVKAFDLTRVPEDFHADPYPYYAALRSLAPIRRLDSGTLFLTRHADLEHIYRNPKLFSSDKKTEFRPKFGNSPIYEHHTTSLVFNDPPLHTQVRRVLQGAVTSRALAAMEPQLVKLVGDLLDRAEALERVDLITDFAAAIPIEVIGNLLGVPQADRTPLRGWSTRILGALEPAPDEAQLRAANTAVTEFMAYLEGLVAERRTNLRDPQVDVLSRLLLSQDDGVGLTEAELLHNCIFLLNAGHETTTNLIGNALAVLARNPIEKRRMTDDPRLITTAIEEILRFESPNQLGNRMTTQTVEIGGETIAAGTSLTLCIGAANRDPAQFKDPDRLDLGRSPNRHLAFASGTHLCLGMNFARLEARIAIPAFLARFPNFRLEDGLSHGRRIRFRGYAHLPAQLR